MEKRGGRDTVEGIGKLKIARLRNLQDKEEMKKWKKGCQGRETPKREGLSRWCSL